MLKNKKRVLGLSALRALGLTLPLLAGATTISYQVIDLPDTAAGNLWQYLYQVSPFNFLQAWGFDILFPLAQGCLAGDWYGRVVLVNNPTHK